MGVIVALLCVTAVLDFVLDLGTFSRTARSLSAPAEFVSHRVMAVDATYLESTWESVAGPSSKDAAGGGNETIQIKEVGVIGAPSSPWKETNFPWNALDENLDTTLTFTPLTGSGLVLDLVAHVPELRCIAVFSQRSIDIGEFPSMELSYYDALGKELGVLKSASKNRRVLKFTLDNGRSLGLTGFIIRPSKKSAQQMTAASTTVTGIAEIAFYTDASCRDGHIPHNGVELGRRRNLQMEIMRLVDPIARHCGAMTTLTPNDWPLCLDVVDSRTDSIVFNRIVGGEGDLISEQLSMVRPQVTVRRDGSPTVVSGGSILFRLAVDETGNADLSSQLPAGYEQAEQLIFQVNFENREREVKGSDHTPRPPLSVDWLGQLLKLVQRLLGPLGFHIAHRDLTPNKGVLNVVLLHENVVVGKPAVATNATQALVLAASDSLQQGAKVQAGQRIGSQSMLLVDNDYYSVVDSSFVSYVVRSSRHWSFKKQSLSPETTGVQLAIAATPMVDPYCVKVFAALTPSSRGLPTYFRNLQLHMVRLRDNYTCISPVVNRDRYYAVQRLMCRWEPPQAAVGGFTKGLPSAKSAAAQKQLAMGYRANAKAFLQFAPHLSKGADGGALPLATHLLHIHRSDDAGNPLALSEIEIYTDDVCDDVNSKWQLDSTALAAQDALDRALSRLVQMMSTATYRCSTSRMMGLRPNSTLAAIDARRSFVVPVCRPLTPESATDAAVMVLATAKAEKSSQLAPFVSEVAALGLPVVWGTPQPAGAKEGLVRRYRLTAAMAKRKANISSELLHRASLGDGSLSPLKFSSVRLLHLDVGAAAWNQLDDVAHIMQSKLLDQAVLRLCLPSSVVAHFSLQTATVKGKGNPAPLRPDHIEGLISRLQSLLEVALVWSTQDCRDSSTATTTGCVEIGLLRRDLA